jgi:ribose/xylose/arabinose/galactoside ABC-type transport system permease subunit
VTVTSEIAPAQNGAGYRSGVLGLLSRVNFLVLPLLLIIVTLSLFSPQFLTAGNFENVMRLAAIYIILGVGQTFVMTTGNIDLSVGSMAALIMALVGTFVVGGGSLPVSIAYAVLLGAAFGTINGLLVTKLRIPALLATLGALVTYRGSCRNTCTAPITSGFPTA